MYEQYQEKLQQLKVDIVALSIITLAALREAYVVLMTVDVADLSFDDVSYLYGSLTNPEYSPVYVLWLDMLEKAVGTLNALFVHQVIMLVLFPFTFYALLRFRQQSPFIAATVTLLLLPSLVIRPYPTPTPLVSAFAIVIGLI